MAQPISINSAKERDSNQQHYEKLANEREANRKRIESLQDIAQYGLANALDFPPPDKMVAELHRRSTEVKKLMIQLKGLI